MISAKPPRKAPPPSLTLIAGALAPPGAHVRRPPPRPEPERLTRITVGESVASNYVILVGRVDTEEGSAVAFKFELPSRWVSEELFEQLDNMMTELSLPE